MSVKRSLLTAVLVIRLSKDEKDKLKKIAISKGLGVSVLARMWLMEKLQENLRGKVK